MNKTELEAAMGTVETFIQIFAILVAIGIIGEVGFGVRLWVLNKRLHAAQYVEDQERQSEIARLESGNLILRGDLERATAATRSKQLELEAAQQKTSLAQKETAEAQRKSAEVHLALRDAAKHAAASRRIIMGGRTTNQYNDTELRGAKFKALEKYANTPAIVIFVQDEEAQILAFDIGNALAKAGWKSVSVVSSASSSIPLGFIREGVQIRTMLPKNGDDVSIPPQGADPPPVVKALIDLLSLDLNPPVGSIGGVQWEPDGFIHGNNPVGLVAYGFHIPENGVAITVGRKPGERYFWAIPDLQPPTTKK